MILDNISTTKKLIYMSLLVSQALVLSIIEKNIPVPFIMPGAKLGLANIIMIVAIYIFGYKEAFLIVVIRIILSNIFGGGLSSFIYSFSGGIFSFIIMSIIHNVLKNRISIVGISVVGSIFHNLGQIVAAMIVLKNTYIISYLPMLTIISIPTGIFVGYVSKFLIQYLKKIKIASIK